MAKSNLLFSAGSLQQLQEMINKYYYSQNWIIIHDKTEYRAYNSKLDRYSENRIVQKGGRWRFELADG